MDSYTIVKEENLEIYDEFAKVKQEMTDDSCTTLQLPMEEADVREEVKFNPETTLLFPFIDIVCILLETPFTRFKEYKKGVLCSQRPMPILTVNKTVNINRTGQSYNRKFKNLWYEQYRWLCGSHYLQKLFCWPCLLLSNKQSVWNKIGFDDFLNVTRALHKHEGSSEHLKCSLRFKRLNKSLNITTDTLKENDRLYIIKFNENVQLNRRFMELPIDAVLYLGKQELAVRSNFKELLKILVKRSPIDIQNHYEKIKSVFSGDCKIIENEIVQCISDYIQETISTEIDEAYCFSIQTDIVQKSQCSIILRYVNSSAQLVERFYGFFDIESNRTTETLFNIVHLALERYNYKSKLIAQCYDGLIAMSDHLDGLQTKIKQVVPQAVFVHCLAHRLNLVLQQTVTNISECRIFFANISGLASFFSSRTFLADSVIGSCIPIDLDTSWLSNSKILNIIATEWDGLKQTFEQTINDPSSDEASIRQSEGFLRKFNEFQFSFLVLVFNEIFELSDPLFQVLQNKSLNVSCCLLQIKFVCEKLESKRNEEKCKEIYYAASLKTTVLADDHIFQNHKVLYYEILDTILLEIDTRFKDMKKLLFISLGDSHKFDEYSKKFPTASLTNLKESYPNLFGNMEVHRLKNELEIIYSDGQYRDKNLQEVVQLLHENADVFKEAYKLFCLILTIPSTNSSVGRNFCCLKRIETFLRNSMMHERVSCLGRISIEKELLLELETIRPFYEDIINKFSALKDRKIDLIFKK